MKPDPLLSPSQVADILGCGRNCAERLMKLGAERHPEGIPSRDINPTGKLREYRTTEAYLTQWIEEIDRRECLPASPVTGKRESATPRPKPLASASVASGGRHAADSRDLIPEGEPQSYKELLKLIRERERLAARRTS